MDEWLANQHMSRTKYPVLNSINYEMKYNILQKPCQITFPNPWDLSRARNSGCRLDFPLLPLAAAEPDGKQQAIGQIGNRPPPPDTGCPKSQQA